MNTLTVVKVIATVTVVLVHAALVVALLTSGLNLFAVFALSTAASIQTGAILSAMW